ncbi:MAG: DMT family transporter, partial [Burkholderiales bacterium]
MSAPGRPKRELLPLGGTARSAKGASMIARYVSVRSQRGAYVALGVLTLLWGTNWVVMKQALTSAHPIVYNIERTWVAIVVLFAVLVARRRPMLPESWAAVAVTGFFQTTVNMGSTTMALADGGAGRAAVLVFTMPFWTVLLAWPVLGERVRGIQWIALALALAGLTLVVEPWEWRGELKPKAWAVLSGFGWACGTIAMKYFQRARGFDMLNFIA